MSEVDPRSEFEPHSAVDVIDLQYLARIEDLVPEIREHPADDVLYPWVPRWVVDRSENKKAFQSEANSPLARKYNILTWGVGG